MHLLGVSLVLQRLCVHLFVGPAEALYTLIVTLIIIRMVLRDIHVSVIGEELMQAEHVCLMRI